MRKIIFVSDFFADQLIGGAELSLQALIDVCKGEVIKVKSEDVDGLFIKENKKAFWVIGNYTNLKYTLLPLLAESVEYCVIEFDYKFCKYRNPQLHKFSETVDCNCYKTFGKRIEEFYRNAKIVFWMSEAQLNIYREKLPRINETNNIVLCSIFSDDTLDHIKRLRTESNGKKNDEWIVTGHESWVKGFHSTVKYCEENKLKYRVVYSVAHKKLLEILAYSKGLVYQPSGEDTCPRLIIEAKLLGCELIINDFVQHKNEQWFTKDNLEEMDIFLRYRKYLFLSKIKEFVGEHEQEKIGL